MRFLSLFLFFITQLASSFHHLPSRVPAKWRTNLLRGADPKLQEAQEEKDRIELARLENMVSANRDEWQAALEAKLEEWKTLKAEGVRT